MDFYAELAATALRLIKDKGRQLPIRRLAVVHNPVTGAITSTVTTSSTIDCIVTPLSKRVMARFNDSLFEGLSLTKIRFLLIAASSAAAEPAPLDEVDLGGRTYSVIGETPLNPAGTPLVYMVAMSLK